MRKEEVDARQEIINRIKTAVIMSSLSIAAALLLILFIAFLIEGEVLPPETAEIGSMVVIILITFLASIIAVGMQKGKTLISGLSVSVLTVLLLLFGSLFFKGGGEPSVIIISGCILAGAAAGLIGGRKRKIR